MRFYISIFLLILFSFLDLFPTTDQANSYAKPESLYWSFWPLGSDESSSKLDNNKNRQITFKDVAGVDEAKEELMEVVEFLKNPDTFTAFGARIPKGVLIAGPPGTGKTLMAKAVAGEADCSFISISGSDFVELYVGVGAKRVRDLFNQGRKKTPCIIFIDEIDAVGRERTKSEFNIEGERTLNQLLVEMDGFDTAEGIVVIASTNRPDILDKALLRSGRFDRMVILDLPDVKGRYDILNVHAKGLKLDPSVDLMNIARITSGSSGADLENILNEAALLAVKRKQQLITNCEVRDAADKVLFGKERRSLEIDLEEKRKTAFHEAGHALVNLCVEHGEDLSRVTIIPRGFSLGATHLTPKKQRLNYWKKEMLDQLAILMGGRAAEELFFNDISSGAHSDISRATHLARAMVCEWGMSEILGNVTYDEKERNGNSQKFSEKTAEKIDQEVFRLIDEAFQQAKKIISEHKEQMELIAEGLIEFETLSGAEVKQIMDNN